MPPEPVVSEAAPQIDLDAGNLTFYLRHRGVAPAEAEVRVSALAGGISNTVLCAEWSGGAVVVKQSLARLRVSANWEFDRGRIFIERDCLNALGEIRPGVAPTVVFADDANFAFGMTLAPPGGEVWRHALAAGRTDSAVVGRAATLLAEVQAAASTRPGLSKRFASQMPLLEGRIDPFHRYVALAHPELAPQIRAEVERTLRTRSTLVHGDFSPKNLISYPDRLLLLDCEVAHWGDPAFDVAFLLCHLLLDGAHVAGQAPLLAEMSLHAWRCYQAAGGTAETDAVTAELGCLLLARVDGKSPLANLSLAMGEAVRQYAGEVLRETPPLEYALERAAGALAHPAAQSLYTQ